jgi:hypothetical protein
MDEGSSNNQRREIEMLYKLVVDMRDEVNDIKRVLALGMSGVNQYAESHEQEGPSEGEAYIIEDSGRSHVEQDSYRDFRPHREQPITIEGGKAPNLGAAAQPGTQ